MRNLKKIKKYFLLAALILSFFCREAAALSRMSGARTAYQRGNYRRGLDAVNSYLDDYPADTLGRRMRDVMRQALAARHLKRAYTLVSEGLHEKASRELDKAADYHREFTSETEREFSGLLEEYLREEAAERMIYLLLTDPRPSEAEVNEVKRELRERFLQQLDEEEFKDMEELNKRVRELKEEEEWFGAIEIVSQFVDDNPGLVEAQFLLSELNLLAAEDLYSRAIEYALRGDSSQAVEKVRQAESYNREYVQEKVKEEMEQVRLLLSMKKEDEAREKLQALSHLQQEDINPEVFLKILNENDDSRIMDIAMDHYNRQQYEDAAVMFDVLRVQSPEKEEARLYYHLSMARVNIRRQNLKGIREHLINALQIAPGEREAVEIFERLQEVMDVMGISL